MPPVRVGIIGLSAQGQEHLSAALRHPDIEVAALCDLDAERMSASAVRAGAHVRCFTNYRELLQSGHVEAAIVAVPHDLHYDITVAASRHRVHLLKEKPIGRSLHEAQSIAALARQSGIVLQTGVQRRHHATYEALGQRLRERHERIRSAHVEMTVVGSRVNGAVRASGWRGDYGRSGGGIVIDLGYHAVDLAQHLLGPLDLVSVLMWDRGALAPAGVVENQAAITAVAGRAWVRIHVGRTGEKRESVVIDCESGRYRADRHEVTWNSRRIATADANWEQTQHGQIDAFISAVRGGHLREASVDDQVPVIRFIEECYAKARMTGAIGETGAR